MGNAIGFRAVERTHERIIPQQQDISATLSRHFNDEDLRAANHAALTFYHAHNLYDHIVELHCCLHVLECARAIGATRNCPNREDIGGDLLNVNANNYKLCNLAKATNNTNIFGLSMLGDRATIKNGSVQCYGV